MALASIVLFDYNFDRRNNHCTLWLEYIAWSIEIIIIAYTKTKSNILYNPKVSLRDCWILIIYTYSFSLVWEKENLNKNQSQNSIYMIKNLQRV